MVLSFFFGLTGSRVEDRRKLVKLGGIVNDTLEEDEEDEEDEGEEEEEELDKERNEFVLFE